MVASWAVEWVAGWAVQWAVLLVGVSVFSLVDLWAASSAVSLVASWAASWAVSTAGPKVLQRVAHSDDLSAEPMVHLKDHK